METRNTIAKYENKNMRLKPDRFRLLYKGRERPVTMRLHLTRRKGREPAKVNLKLEVP